MYPAPGHDGPPIARDAVGEAPPLLRLEAPPAEKPRPRTAGNGAAAPRFATKAGYLAVHSVEKSFGSRQVVRGVSIYVRRGEAVGLVGPDGAGKTTGFYNITRLIKAGRRRHRLDGQ